MNYDVYEVELDTGIPGYRLLQHIKAVDAKTAQAQVEEQQGASAIAVLFRRPCTTKEIAEAVAEQIVPDGTVATPVDAQGAPIIADLVPVEVAQAEIAP